MAGKQQKKMSRVRDMYEEISRDKLTKSKSEEYRQRTLEDNPDFLYRVYQQGKLHMVMFRPSNHKKWMKIIESRNITESLQLTMSGPEEISKISLYGNEIKIKKFCGIFNDMYEEFIKIIKEDEGAAAQWNLKAEIDELRKRIEELEKKILEKDACSDQDVSS